MIGDRFLSFFYQLLKHQVGDIHYHNHTNLHDKCQMIMEDRYVQLLNYRRQLYAIDRVHNMKMDYLRKKERKKEKI